MRKWRHEKKVTEQDLEQKLNELERQGYSIYKIETITAPGATGATAQFRILASIQDLEGTLREQFHREQATAVINQKLQQEHEKELALRSAANPQSDQDKETQGARETTKGVSYHTT